MTHDSGREERIRELREAVLSGVHSLKAGRVCTREDFERESDAVGAKDGIDHHV